MPSNTPTDDYYALRSNCDGPYEPEEEDTFVDEVVDCLYQVIKQQHSELSQLRSEVLRMRVERHAGNWVA